MSDEPALAAPTFKVINPDHPDYDEHDFEQPETRRSKNTEYYNEVAERYNETEVGAFLICPIPPTVRYANMRNIFKSRGLEVRDDYIMTRETRADDGSLLPRENRPFKLKRLTEKVMRVVD